MGQDYEPDSKDRQYGQNVLPNGRIAPVCNVRFRCPKCGQEGIEDAFLGAVLCMCIKPFGTAMTPISIVRDVVSDGYHPDSTPRVMEAIRERMRKNND